MGGRRRPPGSGPEGVGGRRPRVVDLLRRGEMDARATHRGAAGVPRAIQARASTRRGPRRRHSLPSWTRTAPAQPSDRSSLSCKKASSAGGVVRRSPGGARRFSRRVETDRRYQDPDRASRRGARRRRGHIRLATRRIEPGGAEEASSARCDSDCRRELASVSAASVPEKPRRRRRRREQGAVRDVFSAHASRTKVRLGALALTLDGRLAVFRARPWCWRRREARNEESRATRSSQERASASILEKCRETVSLERGKRLESGRGKEARVWKG